MSIIRNGDEVLVLRHVTKDEIQTINSDWARTYQTSEKLVAIAFKNTGNTTLTINNAKVVAVGDALISFKGEIGVYKKQQFKVDFGTGSTPSCEVYETFETDSFLESVKIPLTVAV